MKTLTKTEMYKMGKFDKGGRYNLNTEFQTETSRAIRSPSRAWTLSIWTHCKTAKFYKSLSNTQIAAIK